MFIAELHGKLSSHNENSEDILTSNFFSFLKYANRSIFLKRFLESMELLIADNDCKNAEFRFWYRFEEHTEPDVIMLIGNYYLLFEAKLFSGFGEERIVLSAQKQAVHIKQQLLREYEMGNREACTLGREFKLIPITKDYSFRSELFKDIPSAVRNKMIWVNWQRLTIIIMQVLSDRTVSLTPEIRLMVEDMYELLVRKDLRSFQGSEILARESVDLGLAPTKLFFGFHTALFRGDFIGFTEAFTGFKGSIENIVYPVFFKGGKE